MHTHPTPPPLPPPPTHTHAFCSLVAIVTSLLSTQPPRRIFIHFFCVVVFLIFFVLFCFLFVTVVWSGMPILSMKMMFCTLLLLLLAVTSCVHSDTGNDTGVCVTDEGNAADNSRNCSWARVSELCTVVETVAEGGGDSGAGGKARPQLSPARFNLSSFIGGVVLVLCLQAGGVLAMRFLKSKDQSAYDPIEQPQ
ncbi:uncharacterized protein cd164l2 isoform X2 [Hippocampus zosterae]|uniref:uncharacterized protein cd164l2 isoform X2 n=1 Tax=Hippocampus zosterae TaxID=109293 RepID=UPI00223DEE54|nr:uncharacterized protein cd164l2 isoform X2 [Hippocampus zosterae]